MNQTATSTADLAPSSGATLAVRRAFAIAAGSLFIAACAHISFPLFFTPIPMTLQPFAVILVGLFFGPAVGAATLIAYLLEGAAGLPVFTPYGAAGMLRLMGPAGGYLLAYPAAAALAGGLLRLSRTRSFFAALGAAAAADALILTAGACWLALVTHQHGSVVLQAAVLPFLPTEAIKVVLAASLAAVWARSRFHAAHAPSAPTA